ncbi:MAG: hypothetical protein ACLPVO_12240 [Desulfomonilaceae bacterium]|nr:hypothetical protein [Syntrophaceae bacterium]
MKTVKEVTVQIPNKPGALSNILEILGSNAIYALGFSLNVSGDHGDLSLITSDPSRTQNIFESSGFPTSVRERLVATVPQHPGAMNAILKPLKAAGVNLENMYYLHGAYAVLKRSLLALAVDDNAKAYDALVKDWIEVKGDEVLGY